MSLFDLISTKKPSKTIEKENISMKFTSVQHAQLALVTLGEKLRDQRDSLFKQMNDYDGTLRLIDQKRRIIHDLSKANEQQAILRRAMEIDLNTLERKQDPEAILELKQRHGKVQSMLSMIDRILIDNVPKLSNLKYQADKYSEDAARDAQNAERYRGQFEQELARVQFLIEGLTRQADEVPHEVPPYLAGRGKF